MPLSSNNSYDAQRLSPLALYTHMIALPTTPRSVRSFRFIPSQRPITLLPLPDLPSYSQSSPTLSSGIDSIATAGHEHTYPPTRYITPKPSAQSLATQSSCYGSSQNLLSQYPKFNYGVMRRHRVYILEAVDSGQVWIRSDVTLISQDEISEGIEAYRGRLISMCEQRKNTAWFVFKDDKTKKLHLVEVRNGMIKYPLWRRVITYLRSLHAYVHARRFGHQLPL